MSIKKYLETIEDLSNRKIAITGATSGIGLALTRHLAKKGAKVVLLARNLQKAKKVQDELKECVVDIIEYDQSSYKSIERGIDILLKNHPDIDTYVLNAGVLGEKGLTEDGYASTIAINYLGVRHFIEYISPKIKTNIRFVIQGSIVAGLKLKEKNFKDPKIGFFDQYNISKIYLEAYFYHLLTKNEYPNIEYILTEPGISATRVIRNFNRLIRVLGKGFLTVFFHSPKKACLPLLKGIDRNTPNGSYIVPCGLFTMGGYPKIKEFPNKRKREYLFK